MRSLRCRLLLFLLHHRHFLRGALKRESALDWEHSLDKVRQATGKSSQLFGRLPKDVAVEPTTANGVPAEWIRPVAARKDAAILYFHGGGYVLGSIAQHRGIVAKFAKGSGLAALLFEYRLAPEHPYPAALNDALAAYRGLLAQGFDPAKIVFMGDSAGGGLSLSTLLALRDAGDPLPAGCAALSPWTDLTCSGESLRTNAATCLAPTGSWLACRKHYAGDRDPLDPYLSPLHGDLRGLPPLYLCAGGAETLLDDATRFAEKAAKAGTEVTLRIGQGLFHCYPACAPLFPEATREMVSISAFLKSMAA